MIGLLLITHPGLASTLVATAQGMLGELPRPTDTIEIDRADDTDERASAAEAAAARLDDGDGLLVITDAFGATPSNIATALAATRELRVVAGLNLPMLVRVYNYPHLDLDELAESALEGGRTGVIDCLRPDRS